MFVVLSAYGTDISQNKKGALAPFSNQTRGD
ncbi:TPA: hypothetical protein GRI87_09780 [Vibrio parahaemolyticus]|nr:hypothetical protein [Vibrio parahaemolyticus]